MAQQKPAANESYSWSKFDSEEYFQHYYGEPHPDDDLVIQRVCTAIQRYLPDLDGRSTVDVGTGPNLYPLMCMLPRASSMTSWEYSPSNVDWLRRELADDTMRPQWRHFWKMVVDSYGTTASLPANPFPELRARSQVRNASVYELPERHWDAATMFFCAESITERRDEFERACFRFAHCVRPGGMLIAAFLVGSSAYAVAGRPFPILNVSQQDIRDVLSPLCTDLETEPIGIVDEEIRSGYSGMVLITARAL